MENSYYNLFLDDIRSPTNVLQAWNNGQWVEFPSHYTWVIVRSYKEFVETITLRGLPAKIAFDHDLSYEDQCKTDYSTFKELTGLDCAKYIVKYCLDKDLPLPEF